MKMSHEPGWLMKACRDARMRVMLDHNPSTWIANKPPISEEEAVVLYTMVAKRFEAWTGKTLIDFSNQQLKEPT